MYLGALILLYRQMLVAPANQLAASPTWASQVSVEEAQRYRFECAVAGQEIARLLQLIAFDGTLSRRCWLIM